MGLLVFFQNQIEKDQLENIRGELLRSSGLSESEVSYTNLVIVNVAQSVMCLAADTCLTANRGDLPRYNFYGHSPPFG